MKKYILIIFILATVWSCTKTIEFNDKGTGSLMVVNSLIYPDSCISGTISQSTSILKSNTVGTMLNGTVDLYENGILVRQMTSTLGNFRATDFKPKAGNTYRIAVSANGKQVEAETVIPNQAEVISVDTTTINNDWGSKSLNFKFKVKDGTGDDYFRIIVINDNLSFYYQDKKTRIYFRNSSSGYFDTNDPIFNSLYSNYGNDALNMGPGNQYHIFPDDYFEGKEYTFQFQVAQFLNYGNNQVYNRFVIHVQKLSKDMFNYMKYLDLYNYYRDDPFSEPVPVYSNIKNGAGIFAGYNDDARFTFEKIYIPYSMDTIKVQDNPNGYGGYPYPK
jgi:hypothetical protein